jgi:hypothetical protein
MRARAETEVLAGGLRGFLWFGKSACGSVSPIYHLLASKPLGWWNGRHVRLRGVCRKACGFKSRPEHHRAACVETPSRESDTRWMK